jgi:hypothetical protein
MEGANSGRWLNSSWANWKMRDEHRMPAPLFLRGVSFLAVHPEMNRDVTASRKIFIGMKVPRTDGTLEQIADRFIEYQGMADLRLQLQAAFGQLARLAGPADRRMEV